MKSFVCFVELRSMVRLISLVLMIFFIFSAKVAAQEYVLVNRVFNRGPLADNLPSGPLFDWADKALVAGNPNAMFVNRNVRADGVVKYQNRSGSVMYILNWSLPFYHPATRSIIMYMAVQRLRGPLGPVRVFAYGNVGATIDVFPNQGGAYVIGTNVLPRDFVLTVGGGDGSTLNEAFFAKYYFQRRQVFRDPALQ